MQLGFVGLGRMGLNMVTRLTRGGHAVVAPDRSVPSLEAIVSALAPPRAIWLMVPAGDPTESTVTALAALLSPGDVLVDGGERLLAALRNQFSGHAVKKA